MNVSVTDAKSQLTELVRRSEAGDEIVLTRHGRPIVRLVPVGAVPDRKALAASIRSIQAAATLKATPGPDAARSQDFLYDEAGLPR